MKIGIYVPGLGQNYKEESVLKYATRFMHELDWNHEKTKNVYTLRHETIFLGYNSNKKELNKQRTTKVSIVERQADLTETVVYSFYDLPYESILTDTFNASNIFRKSVLLLLTIMGKFPRIFLGMFNKGGTKYFSQKKRFQSFYAIILLISIGLGGILLIPSFITVFSSVEALPGWVSNMFSRYFSDTFWQRVSHYIIAASLVVFTITPRINQLIISLTTKLVCIHYYLQIGERKQAILGHLDHLLEFISEHEDEDTTIHLHACDFGAILCYDLLFPMGAVPSERVRQKVKCFCTVSFPYEFISSYYPLYFNNRCSIMSDSLYRWYNIYSLPDFFSTNLRPDTFRSSINNPGSPITPVNIHYDIVERDMSVFDFIAFFSLKTYQYYWDDSTDGTSCLRLLVRAMMRDGLL